MTPFPSLAEAAHLPWGRVGFRVRPGLWYLTTLGSFASCGEGPALEAGAPPSRERAQAQTQQGQGMFVASATLTVTTHTFCLALGPSRPDSRAFAQCGDTASSWPPRTEPQFFIH